MRRIDSHHHFWGYSTEQYPWISDSMSMLKQDFLPEELFRMAKENNVESVVSVQARQNVDETHWLLELANDREWILGIVGWLPLADPHIRQTMESFCDQRKLVGLRHVIQDEQDDQFMSRPEFNRGISAIKEFGWVYDLLIYGRQLPFAIPLVDRHPDQLFVLDHIAKPTIRSSCWDKDWATNFQELAKRPNVLCKFSGVVTEVRDDTWDATLIRPYWETALNAFGTQRLMFGSDWPVCLLKTTYQRWMGVVETLASQLTAREQSDFWFNNAVRAYGRR